MDARVSVVMPRAGAARTRPVGMVGILDARPAVCPAAQPAPDECFCIAAYLSSTGQQDRLACLQGDDSLGLNDPPG